MCDVHPTVQISRADLFSAYLGHIAFLQELRPCEVFILRTKMHTCYSLLHRKKNDGTPDVCVKGHIEINGVWSVLLQRN